MPNITLHRSTADAEHWVALIDGSLVAEGAYKDVKQAARIAAAPRGKVSIGSPITLRAGTPMMVRLQPPPKTVDTGKGIAGGVAKGAAANPTKPKKGASTATPSRSSPGKKKKPKRGTGTSSSASSGGSSER